MTGYIVTDYRQKGIGPIRAWVTLVRNGEIELRYGHRVRSGVVLLFRTIAILTTKTTEDGELIFKDGGGRTFYLSPERYRRLLEKNGIRERGND